MKKIISFVFSVVIATFNADAGNQYANNTIGSNDEPVINGHKYVDLGLPSGLKWATCNVGAINPEDYGNYYAWGETSTKKRYTRKNYAYNDIKLEDFAGDPQYDVASKEWGGSWRMPTEEEVQELFANCECTWTTRNGVAGCLLKSNTNNNSIFLPANGWREGRSLNSDKIFGDYWSSTPFENPPFEDDGHIVYILRIHSTNQYSEGFNTYLGCGIRPVCK